MNLKIKMGGGQEEVYRMEFPTLKKWHLIPITSSQASYPIIDIEINIETISALLEKYMLYTEACIKAEGNHG